MSQSIQTVGLLAGRGNYPVTLCEQFKKSGLSVVVAGLKGQFSERSFGGCKAVKEFPIGSIKRVAEFFKSNGASRAFLAGGVMRRGAWRHYSPDLAGLLLLPRALFKGDNELLTHVSAAFLKCGIHIGDPALFLDSLLADDGLLAGPAPDEYTKGDMDIAWSAANEFGRTDRGQSVIVYGGQVVSVEDREGTDALITRAPGPGAILCKVVKQDQDRRFDLPAIGVSTAILAQRVGLSAIVIQAGGVLLLDRERLFDLCNQHNITLFARR